MEVPAIDELRTIDDLDVEGERVLLRADLDVPLARASDDGRLHVADVSRLRAALTTIEELRRRGARLVLASHLGSPHREDPTLSMRPIAERLERLTGIPVPLAPGVVGPDVRALTEQLLPGEMLMLENLRFEPGERRNDVAFAADLAALADVYVGDDFRAARRACASTEAVAHRLPAAAGRLIEREVGALSALVDQPGRPLVVVLGGARLREKIGLIRRFLELADVVCIGGAISLPFVAARGHAVGAASSDPQAVALARVAIADAAAAGCRLELPRDVVLAPVRGGHASIRTWPLDGVAFPAESSALDIGPRTAERYVTEIVGAATMFWSGPMGRHESAPFDAGTYRVANAVAAAPAMTVVAGAQTISALQSLGLRDHVSHLSTGGAATVQFLEVGELPGVRALVRDDAGSPTALSGLR
jgi:phosphoglycerate kinase